MPNFEQFPQNVNNQEGQADNNKDKKKKPSWLRRTVLGVTGAAMMGSAVEAKELKNTAEEEFSKEDNNKKELFMDSVNQESDSLEKGEGDSLEQQESLFPTFIKVELGRYGEGQQLKLLDNIKQLDRWEIKSSLAEHLIAGAELTPSEDKKTVEIVIVNPADLGLDISNTYQELVDEAKKRGLTLIKNPAEVIGSICLEDPDKLPWKDSTADFESYIFAMSPYTNQDTYIGDLKYNVKNRFREPNNVLTLKRWKSVPEDTKYRTHKGSAAVWRTNHGPKDLVDTFDNKAPSLYLFQKVGKK